MRFQGMSSGSGVSFIGWIDFTDEDQKRAQDYLRSLNEGTLDERHRPS
jgi:hypothetical protein